MRFLLWVAQDSICLIDLLEFRFFPLVSSMPVRMEFHGFLAVSALYLVSGRAFGDS